VTDPSAGGRARWHRCVAAVVGALLLLAGGAAPASAQLAPPPDPVIDGVPPSWPPAPDLASPVHLLVDAATGQVLSEAGADQDRPVASTIKMLTALTAAQRLDLDDEVVVGDEVVEVPGASVELVPGERWTVRELLVGLLVRSGNDAAEAVAVAAAGDVPTFLELMTATAADVGVQLETPLVSVSGLEDDQQLSARDLAVLARVLLADPELRAIVAAPEVSLPGVGTDENRNLLVGDYPGATGVKTGFTEAAGNSLVASARRADRELVAVVLGGGPDPERFADAAALLDHGFEAFTPVELSASATLLVAGGTRQLTADETAVVVPTGADAAIDLPLPLRVPEEDVIAVPVVVDGSSVATVDVAVEGEAVPPAEGAGSLGRAAVDGVYAALRAAYDAERDR
jgi:serine-type D-Ala-D-Ala carboxypeptidase (penicillin-binding protein 5/6)